MIYPTYCVDNFLENPDEIVEYSNKLKFFKNGNQSRYCCKQTLTAHNIWFATDGLNAAISI